MLPQLLQMPGGAESGVTEEGEGRGGRWIVLDGSLSAFQLDTLLTLFDRDKHVKLSNGRGIPIDLSYRFILEVTYTYIYMWISRHVRTLHGILVCGHMSTCIQLSSFNISVLSCLVLVTVSIFLISSHPLAP